MDQQINSRPRGRSIILCQGDLLANNGCQIGVESEKKLLDVAAPAVRIVCGKTGIRRRVEHCGIEKTEVVERSQISNRMQR